MTDSSPYEGYVDELRERIARLEEALRRIDAIDFDADSSADAYHAVEVAQQIARQALKDTQ